MMNKARPPKAPNLSAKDGGAKAVPASSPADDSRRPLDRERAELALQAARLGEFEWDLATDQLFISERMQAILGVKDDAAAAPAGQRTARWVHPEDLGALQAATELALTSTGRFSVEYRIVRPDTGEVRWIASSGAVVRSRPGEKGRMIGVVEDITARKLDDQQREILVAELDHRVKNVLAAVQSMAAQSGRKAASLKDFLKTFEGRLKTMASAHELLTATRWRGAAIGDIAAAELGGLAPGQTRWEGPELLLTPRAANALSLALHELASNAVKFGALSTEDGRVQVRWSLTPDGGLALDWTESDGPTVNPPTRGGFGTTLMEKVTGRELGGEAKIEYRREGVRAHLTASPSVIAEVRTPAPSLPAEAPIIVDSASAGPPPGLASMVRGLNVLIVEDAILLALELEAGLIEAGAHVAGSAAEVDEAIAMLGRPIDAAVLDCNLNGASVQPVAEALQALGVPFVFATGYGDTRFTPQGFDVPVIRKPYNVDQVAAALAEVTGRA